MTGVRRTLTIHFFNDTNSGAMFKRILLIHTRYRWRGGEDANFDAEARLLRERGHEVVEHVADNKTVLERGKLATLKALRQAAWSKTAYNDVRRVVEKSKPDIAHVHNFWFALSPSVLAACHDANIPVVLRLPNFRLICPGAFLLNRRGEICELCIGKNPWRGVLRRCYNDSYIATSAVARMLVANRRGGTWENDVDLFLVPAAFSKDFFVRGGLPADKIAVKPNYVSDPFPDGPLPEKRGPVKALFVGRLSREKGVATLLKAWSLLSGDVDAELHIVGEGPERENLKRLAGDTSIRFRGAVEPERIAEMIAGSSFLVMPSECYEALGLVVIESFSSGRSVVASRIGGPAELVRDGETGLLFAPGDSADLAHKLRKMISEPELRFKMGRAARKEYLALYTPDENYRLLIDRYKQAAAIHAGHSR